MNDEAATDNEVEEWKLAVKNPMKDKLHCAKIRQWIKTWITTKLKDHQNRMLEDTSEMLRLLLKATETKTLLWYHVKSPLFPKT